MKTKLRKQDYVLLYALGLVLALGVSLVQRAPGYTDAEYYFSGGLRLFQGEGFSEMILWNYLDDPVWFAASIACVLDAAALPGCRSGDGFVPGGAVFLPGGFSLSCCRD